MSQESIKSDYLESIRKQFEYYKILGDKTFAQLQDEHLFWQYNEDSNSIATIVKHLWGNMLSRWTDFLTSDGEKTWPDRDAAFENDIKSRVEPVRKWTERRPRILQPLAAVQAGDLDTLTYIRDQGHTVMGAIDRQLAHCPYHVGQTVSLGKMLTPKGWQSLSIPKGKSQTYNAD